MHILCKKTECERSKRQEQREKEEEDNRGQSQFSEYDRNFGHILCGLCLIERRHVLAFMQPAFSVLLLLAHCLCF